MPATGLEAVASITIDFVTSGVAYRLKAEMI